MTGLTDFRSCFNLRTDRHSLLAKTCVETPARRDWTGVFYLTAPNTYPQMFSMYVLAFVAGFLTAAVPAFLLFRLWYREVHRAFHESIRRKGKLSPHTIRRILDLPGLGP